MLLTDTPKLNAMVKQVSLGWIRYSCGGKGVKVGCGVGVNVAVGVSMMVGVWLAVGEGVKFSVAAGALA